MKFILFLIALIQVILSKKELIFVNELFRHGARGTIIDNVWNSDDYKGIAGELTPTGMRQHFILGQALRKEYIDDLKFLDEKLNYDQIYIRSTDFNRTIQSALSQLFGLYPLGTGTNMNDLVSSDDKLPPFKGAKQPENLNKTQALPYNSQPMPIHVDVGVLTYPPDFCPNYNKINQDYIDNQLKDVVDEINANYEETFRAYEKIINYDGTLDFSNIEDVWDVIVADQTAGYPLPQQTGQLYQNLTELDTLDWFVNTDGCPTAAQIQNNDLFISWLENMDMALQKTDFSTGLKWAMYSAHDSNVAGAMVGLGFADYQCNLDRFWNGSTDALNCNYRPYYAASIIVELYVDTDNNTQEVAIKYDGTYQNLCGKAQKYCSYSDFKTMLQKQILSEQEMKNICDGENPNEYIEQLATKKNIEFSTLVQTENSNNNNTEEKSIGYYTFITLVFIAMFLVMNVFIKREKAIYQKQSKVLNKQKEVYEKVDNYNDL